MIPGEASPPPGSPEAAWLDLGSAVARAASALDQLIGEESSVDERAKFERARGDVQKALDEYREANRRIGS